MPKRPPRVQDGCTDTPENRKALINQMIEQRNACIATGIHSIPYLLVVSKTDRLWRTTMSDLDPNVFVIAESSEIHGVRMIGAKLSTLSFSPQMLPPPGSKLSAQLPLN
jgi:hypothetical protein